MEVLVYLSLLLGEPCGWAPGQHPTAAQDACMNRVAGCMGKEMDNLGIERHVLIDTWLKEDRRHPKVVALIDKCKDK